MLNLFGLRIMTARETEDLVRALETIGHSVGQLNRHIVDMRERVDDMEGRLASATQFRARNTELREEIAAMRKED